MHSVTFEQYMQVTWPAYIIAAVVWVVITRAIVDSFFDVFIWSSRGQSSILRRYIDEMSAANRHHDLDEFSRVHLSMSLYIQRPGPSAWTRALLASVIIWIQLGMMILTARLLSLGITQHYFGV